MDYGLTNKVVLVTGANGWIGQELCHSFLGEGAIVYAQCRGDVEKLAQLKDMAIKNGTEKNLKLISINITDPEKVTEGFDLILKESSRLDVLINNAGWTCEQPFVSLKDEDVFKIIDANLLTVIWCSRAALKIFMKQKEGNIVNISSAVAKRHGRGVALYAGLKSAVNRLGECMAIEMGKKNIRINNIAPGVIETNLSTALTSRHNNMLNDMTPLKRFGTPQDVGHAALYLASPIASSFVTGTTLHIDGGIVL